MLPKGALFIVFCFLLRIVMAVGGAGADTACFAVVAGNFGENLGMVMVCRLNRLLSVQNIVKIKNCIICKVFYIQMI